MANRKLIKVAVTGVGGGIGQSILKALSIANLCVEVFPSDIQPLSAGLYTRDRGTVLPRPEIGINAWKEWLRQEKIDALIPGSDYDLLPFALVRDDWEVENVCRIMVSDTNLIAVCRDKALTCKFLAEHGLPAPRSIWDTTAREAAIWAKSMGYPVVLKPRDGSASRHMHIAQDEEELRFYFDRTPNPIVQEYLNLEGEVQEFTCAVFCDRMGNPVGTFMARRDLVGGATYRAEVNFWPEIEDILLSIGKALKPRGPLNVQLRLTPRGPVPFELNLRCSGTSAIRAHFGFNEPEMLLRHYLLGETLTQPETRKGYVLRYWNEVFLESVGRDQLIAANARMRGEVRPWM